MNPTDHERHSERLSAYVRGTLGPEETEETRAHLVGCPMCRQEEAALIALLSLPLEELRPAESERLRAAVLAEIGSEEKPSLAVVPSEAAFVEPRRSWAPRIAQFMAAAAVIALATIYLTSSDVGRIGGMDAGSGPPANGIEDSDGGTEDRRAPGTDEGGGGTGTTVEAEGEVIGDAAGSDGGAGNNADTRTGSDSETESAFGAVGEPPEEGTAEQLGVAMKANRAKFGVAVGYRGRR
jgi:hypothetical protein